MLLLGGLNLDIFSFHSSFSQTANQHKRLRFEKEEQRRCECALTYKISRSKRYKACSDVAQRVGFEPTCGCPQTDFECCLSLADTRLEQVVTGSLVKCRKPRRRKGLRTFRPVSARGDSNRPKVQIKPRSCVKSLRSCAFARSQARKQRPQQRQ